VEESGVKFVWLDGELVDWAAATVHITNFALHYGIGFFEGIRCHGTPRGPALFRLGDHLSRLRRSAAIYGVTLPYSEAILAEACRESVRCNGLTDCYLRPMIFLGEGPNPLSAPFRCAVIASANGPVAGPPPGAGTRAKVSSFQRYGGNALPPAAKAIGQYLNAYLGQGEALRAGYDEAIFVDAAGMVTDGWAHNVFIVSDGVLATPPTWAGGLAGITRDSVLRLAEAIGIPATERALARSDLYTADECFLTGTAAGIVPVVSVDDRATGTAQVGPVTRRLIDELTATVTGASAAYPGWLDYVA
jgi:branched-chain amino acid aminotransferase